MLSAPKHNVARQDEGERHRGTSAHSIENLSERRAIQRDMEQMHKCVFLLRLSLAGSGLKIGASHNTEAFEIGLHVELV
eukprot:178635-Amphidinium_carterae.1